MKMKFIGNPRQEDDQREHIEAYGLLFPLDELVDVSGLEEWQIRRLKGNPHFKVGAKRGRPKKSETNDGNG